MGGEDVDDLRSFPTTHWSQVTVAGLTDRESQRAALDALLRRYLPALRAHLLRRLRVDPDEADDLLQGFIADKVLERGLIARADRGLGKFRTFLCTALDRFAFDVSRKSRAKKRRGACSTLNLDSIDESDLAAYPSAELDLAWARCVLAEAMRRMEAYCRTPGRGVTWSVFEGRILRPAIEGCAAASYESIVSRFGLKSPTQASNALVTGKRVFRRHLRAVVGEYASTEAEVDAELQELREVLERGGGGRLGKPRP